MQTISCVVGWLIACAWFDTNNTTKGKGGPGSTKDVARMVFFAGDKGSAVDVFTDACFGALVTGVVYFGPLMSLLIRARDKRGGEYRGRVSIFIRTPQREQRKIWRVSPDPRCASRTFLRRIYLSRRVAHRLTRPATGDAKTTVVSIVAAIYISPLLFGLAHINHYFGLRKVYGHAKALQSVAFQFIYTTLFGILAGTAFYRCKAGPARARGLYTPP